MTGTFRLKTHPAIEPKYAQSRAQQKAPDRPALFGLELEFPDYAKNAT